MAGPFLPGLPNCLFLAGHRERIEGGQRCFFRTGQVKVLHPLTGSAWSGWLPLSTQRSGSHFGARQALRHTHVAVAEAYCHRSIEPVLHSYAGSAQACANVLARDLPDLCVEADRVVVVHLPYLDVA